MEYVPVRCRIPELLDRIGKNQQWLADKMNLPKQRISDIVNLRANNITIQRAALLAYHLDCSVDDLWKWGWR
ncbi:helix-turn-helix domain-containing protein [Paenibacillus sp. UASWS1643]|uniref:helix-turn-helix domain-containing protein n=1 Tax=Paenibacillus sp. UASWS1643 TaxID=2580422 RepID=UPI0012399155|nr:helix-turn-helix transcriptional regulator [Paenibacillus sp. UASWS1643]KAA8747147.1 helix-turn-helix transcriptional regulator [Paenibacillus sp. UASWS1643]